MRYRRHACIVDNKEHVPTWRDDIRVRRAGQDDLPVTTLCVDDETDLPLARIDLVGQRAWSNDACRRDVRADTDLERVTVDDFIRRVATGLANRSGNAEPTGRLELPTGGLRNRCSTN